MKAKYAVLHRIDQAQPITNEPNYEFMHHLQHALLLALRERGILNVTQYRQAEEKLYQQRRNRAKKPIQQGGTGE